MNPTHLNFFTPLCCEEGPESPSKGEEALWRAVITQALMDAGSHSTKREMRFVKAQAIAWLAGTSQDFHDVCALAGLPADYVRGKAREAIAKNCAWRQHNINSYQKPKAIKKRRVLPAKGKKQTTGSVIPLVHKSA